MTSITSFFFACVCIHLRAAAGSKNCSVVASGDISLHSCIRSVGKATFRKELIVLRVQAIDTGWSSASFEMIGFRSLFAEYPLRICIFFPGAIC